VPVIGSQPSAVALLHAVQAEPPIPQAASVGALQTPPEQQPVGQESASHVHAPPTHSVPAPQAEPVPHRHSPDDEQLLARVRSHAAHTEPPDPHVAVPAGMHVAPEQQPLGQLPALQPLHAPPAQVCAPQSWQAPPPLPQLVSAVPGRQAPPAQQPFGHEVASHTHAPPTQRWPAPHAAPVAPQAHTPLARQRSAVMPHGEQLLPALPQLAIEAGWQLLFAQHPLAHETASHTQLPCTQCCPAAQAGPAP
jgi:hypothetical protein